MAAARNAKRIFPLAGLLALLAVVPLGALHAGSPTQRDWYKTTVPKNTTTFTGTVVEIDVGGNGKNSAQLEFSLLSKTNEKQTFAVWMNTEPQVFAAMTTLLTMAYASNKPVTATFVSTGDTPQAVNIKVPADEN